MDNPCSSKIVQTEWNALQESISQCNRCKRLRDYCLDVALKKRASFANWTYWGRPVPNLGAPDGWLLLVGLAPAAHGANRTGRMFTGDRSGDFLFEALHAVGLANQPHGDHIGDGFELQGCVITAAAHCAPPANKPTPAELANCSPYLDRTIDLMPNLRAILCLGQIGWKEVLKTCSRRGWLVPRPQPRFAHGAIFDFACGYGGPIIGCTYHPSQQNTFTGLLTQEMLQGVLAALQERAAISAFG